MMHRFTLQQGSFDQIHVNDAFLCITVFFTDYRIQHLKGSLQSIPLNYSKRVSYSKIHCYLTQG